MKRSAWAVVMALAYLAIGQGAFAAVIDSRVWPANGHVYYVLTPSSYVDSESQAVALGGHLATINDQAEHDWVWSAFVSFIPSGLAGDGGLWIGYTDSQLFGASEGGWNWVSSESSAFTNWYPGEPNDEVVSHDEDFAFMWVLGEGRWFDADITGSGNTVLGIAEVASHVVPLPAAVWLLGSGFLSYLGFGRWGRQREPASGAKSLVEDYVETEGDR